MTSAAATPQKAPSAAVPLTASFTSKPQVMFQQSTTTSHEEDYNTRTTGGDDYETTTHVAAAGLVEMAKRPSQKIPQRDEDDEPYISNYRNGPMMDGMMQASVTTTTTTTTARDALFRFFYPKRQPEYLGNSSIRGCRAAAAARQATANSEAASPEVADPLQQSPTATTTTQPPFSRPNPIRSTSFLLNDIDDPDLRFVHRFWTTYDDILILSIFTQLGILFRLAVATWFTFFDGVFSNSTPLFVNLPLNCLSCWIMGVLCSGEQLMSIITTRFTPPRTQQSMYHYDDNGDEHDDNNRARAISNQDEDDIDDDEDDIDDLQLEAGIMKIEQHDSDDNDEDQDEEHEQSFEGFDYNQQRQRRGLRNRRVRLPLRRRRRRRHRRKRERDDRSFFHFWQPPVHLNEELRDVQLLALERRIRLSKCLVLFPVKNEDVDVMEHYFNQGYKKSHNDYDEVDAERAVARRQKRIQKHFSLADTELNDLVLSESCHDSASSFSSSSSHTGRHNIKRTSSPNAQIKPSSSSSKNVTHSSEPSPAPNNNSLADSALSPPSTNTANETDDRVEDALVGRIHSPTIPCNQDDDGEQTSKRHANESAVVFARGRTTADTSNATQPLSPDVSSEEEEEDDDGNEDEDSTTSKADQDPDYFADLTNTVQENVDRLSRVNLADGWDAGTTPEAMSDDLLLGLRDGFCGALSSFSSWNAAMAALMRKGEIGDAFVGYMIGLQLPILAYRFGQHVAVFIFVWRTRRETRIAERRGGYGIRVSINEESERDPSEESDDESKKESQLPSIRAVVTAIFIIALVSQITLLTFFVSPHYQQATLSLLFSPLGVFARWRLSRLNQRRPTFPLGTFTANLLACSLSGSLGTLLAGNPGPKQRIVLVSFIDGFGGTLSSLASFVIEILAGIDPILFRFDGVFYAVVSLSCAWAIGFVFSGSVEWADRTTVQSSAFMVDKNDGNRTLHEL